MKRLIGFFLVAFLMFGSAFAEEEIVFNGIPWLSNEKKVMESLIECGLIRDLDISISHDNILYLVKSEGDFVLPDKIQGADDVTYSCSIGLEVKGRIAGYPLKNLVLTYAYDGEYKLIAVRVELINAKYDDIKGKIKRVYGEGQETITEEQICSIVWKGENNSAVVLYTQSDGMDYTLMYGRLDAAKIVADCFLVDEEDVSGL